LIGRLVTLEPGPSTSELRAYPDFLNWR